MILFKNSIKKLNKFTNKKIYFYMQQNQIKIEYPITKRDNTIDKHNQPDPYRWLEDPDSKETSAWVEQQNKITNSYLNQYEHKQLLNKKLTEIYEYEKYGPPYKRGENYYFSKNNGLQNQYVTYTVKNLSDQPEVFIDPNTLSEDGTVALSNSSFSENGQLWAYSLSKGGSDWKTVYVKDVNTKKDLEDKLQFVKFCGFSWTHDNKGFFYNQYPKPQQIESTEEGDKAGTETDSNLNQKVYYHRIGTPQSEDILIFENPEDPKKSYSAEVSDDGKYLILNTHDGCSVNNKLYLADISQFSNGNYEVKFNKIIDEFESMYNFISNEGSNYYFLTNCGNTLKNQVISINIEKPQKENWQTIIKQTENVLQEVYAVNKNQFLAIYNKDVKDVMHLYDLQGQFIREIPTPCGGSIGITTPKKNQEELFYLFTSFLYPTSIYHYKYDTNKSELFKASEIEGFDTNDYETKQIFYENKNDKTKIPMYIIQKKGSTDNQTSPFYLYGYGGFNISISPSFSPFRIIMMKHLGINIAIANIRGGGEYGEDWHQQGTKDKKQNVFDDFCSAAEYLIENKYTTSDKLAICGGSNGGLLVGACVNQRPDLFRVGIAQVGVLDMLRFHLFTIGHAWCSDYGNPDNEEDFKYLIKYSPLHNVNKNKKGYPAILLTTGDHDDRVVPLHSFKYISELQYQLGQQEYQKEPLLIRVETKAGHGAGKPTTKVIEEITDIYGFMSLVMGLKWIE